MAEEQTTSATEVPEVPESIPRIYTPHEALSAEKARILNLAAWEMANPQLVNQEGDQNG